MLAIQVRHKYQVMKAIELCRFCLLVDKWNVCVAGWNTVKTEYVESYTTVFTGMVVYLILSRIHQHVNIWSTIILSDSVFGFVISWLFNSFAVKLLPCCFSFACGLLFKYKYLHSLGVRKESYWAIIGEKECCIMWWMCSLMKYWPNISLVSLNHAHRWTEWADALSWWIWHKSNFHKWDTYTHKAQHCRCQIQMLIKSH
jgi:hypothetical protein